MGPCSKQKTPFPAMKKHANQTTAGHRNPENGRSFVSGIGPVLLLTTIFPLNFSARVIYASLMPEIEKDLRMSHSAAGPLSPFQGFRAWPWPSRGIDNVYELMPYIFRD